MDEPTHITAERIVRELTGAALKNGNSSATVTVQAGGIVMALCTFMLGANLVMAGLVLSLALRVEDLDDKLSAVYMMAPHLKPDEG